MAKFGSNVKFINHIIRSVLMCLHDGYVRAFNRAQLLAQTLTTVIDHLMIVSMGILGS